MLTETINFKNFKNNLTKKNIRKKLKKLINDESDLIKSLSIKYNDSFSKKLVNKYKNSKNFRVIYSGSILGTQAI